MPCLPTDDVIEHILRIYSSISFKPPPMQYTVASSFYLTIPSSRSFKIISIATGTKCLPAVRLPLGGEALHDSHAEVLARRGAIRWFLEELGRCHDTSRSNCFQSQWISKQPDGKYDLCDGVQINLYVSTVPCGDASTRFLASIQDEEMAILKDSGVYPTLGPTEASRGRDDYSRIGVLRTKPGRADSPPTLSMSCSDKIASWGVLGFQGALASRFFRPLYLSTVILGEVQEAMRGMVKEDCERALWRRVKDIHSKSQHPSWRTNSAKEDLPTTPWPSNYHLHIPEIKFTDQPFSHSRTVLACTAPTKGSCNESLCWIADTKQHEVLINGMKRGVSPKHRFRPQSRPQVSKIALFQLYQQTVTNLSPSPEPQKMTYFEVKHAIIEYQATKEALVREDGPLAGWVKSGSQLECFDMNGEYHETLTKHILHQKCQ